MLRRLGLLTTSVALLFSLVAVVLPSSVAAVDLLQPVCNNSNKTSDPTICAKDNSTNRTSNPLVGPNGILTTYINILSLVVAIASIVVIMIAGMRFITAQGDPAGITGARNTVLYAIVGLLVAAFARIMVTFVLARIGA